MHKRRSEQRRQASPRPTSRTRSERYAQRHEGHYRHKLFVSGVFFRGPPHRILHAWRDGLLQIIVSPEIISEYERVGRKLEDKYGRLAFQPMMALVLCHATLVEAPPLAEPACADPDDDKFIACALASECALIISGDRHLLDVDGHAGIRTLRPRDFVEEYLPSNQ